MDAFYYHYYCTAPSGSFKKANELEGTGSIISKDRGYVSIRHCSAHSYFIQHLIEGYMTYNEYQELTKTTDIRNATATVNLDLCVASGILEGIRRT